jgi:ATP/ADP translocase
MTRLGRSLGLRPGEGPLVAVVAAIFATIELGRGFGEVAADSLVIEALGNASLPWLFIALGVVGLVVALAYGAALGRARRATLSVIVLLVVAFAIAAQQLGLVAGLPLVAPLWLTVNVAGAIAATLAWTLAGSVLDARQAKRLFPTLGSAAIAGSFVGTLGAGPAAAWLGTAWVPALEALLFVLTAFLVTRLTSTAAGQRLRTPPAARPIVAELRAGFDFVIASPLMRLVAVAYVLFAILMFSVTSPFFRAMAEAFPPGATAERATALGLLSAAVTATSFVVSLVVAPRFYARFGVATTALVLPVVYLLGFGVWLVAFTPATAIAVRYAQQVTQRGLSNSTWSAFYNTVPADRRAQVLAFNDGVPGQIGTILSGVLLLTAGAFLAPSQVFVLGALAALVCLVVVLAIRRRYGDSLVRALRAGLGEQVLEGGPGLGALAADAQATNALVTGLGAPEPIVRRTAVELLGRMRAPGAAAVIAPLVADEDPSVRAAAVEALAALDPATAAVAVDRAIEDTDPAVRAAAIRSAATTEPDVVIRVAERLTFDPSAEVRGGLAVALDAAGEGERSRRLVGALLAADDAPSRVAGLAAIGAIERASRDGASREDGRPPTDADPVVAALDDEAGPVRRAAADILRARSTIPDGVLGVLETGSPRAQEAALRSLDGHGAAARAAVLRWAGAQVERATALRARRAALEGGDRAGGSDGAREFLLAVLGRRQAEIELRLLQALAVLGAPEAAGLIRRCLRSGDADTRAQAVEALDVIGDAQLRHGVVALLDDAPPTIRSADAVLEELEADPDRWIRVLALRARAEALTTAWGAIRERAAADPDTMVRDALAPLAAGGPTVPDPARTLGDIDRMLFLRRVPLFAGLAPEDLQRLAMTASERLYAANETVFREGDLGDELVVIVDGSVRVVRTEADGRERMIRTYGAGDHFGELALLREAPRAATVVAEPPGIRGLVIGGEGLSAILRERPEAAMAMLATLAQRISEQ